MGYNNLTGLPEILVAQPGGTFLIVDHTGKMQSNPLLSSSTPSSISSVGAQTEIICVSMEPPSLPLSSKSFLDTEETFSFLLVITYFSFLLLDQLPRTRPLSRPSNRSS